MSARNCWGCGDVVAEERDQEWMEPEEVFCADACEREWECSNAEAAAFEEHEYDESEDPYFDPYSGCQVMEDQWLDSSYEMEW